MVLRGPVLVAVDLTDADEEVLRQASAIARSLGTRLVVCHVLSESFQARMLFPQLAQVDTESHAGIEEKALEVLEAHVIAVTDRPASDFDAVIEAGSPHAGILNRIEEIHAGLAVLGPGAVAERVARYAPCAVMIARPSAHGSVLGATDYSDPSLPAIEAAGAEATRRGVPLRLIHCIEAAEPIVIGSHSFAIGVLPALPSAFIERLEKDSRERLQSSFDRLGIKGESIISRGRASLAIVEAARESPTELVVIGIRGRSNLSRLLLGSVAESILKTAPCSVLVVHTTH